MFAAALLAAWSGLAAAQLPLERLDQYLVRAQQFGLSGALAVVQQDRVIYTRGFGYSDVAIPLPMTTATGVDIASLSKQITAAAILKLEEQGRLKRTDAISRFIRSAPTDKAAITIDQLLLHRSGLPQFYMAGNDFQRVTRDSALAGIMKAPLRFPPGTNTQYSDAGYTLLAIIIELVSGRTYENFVSAELFVPLGMTSTSFYGPSSRERRDIARGYVGTADHGAPSLYAETADYWIVKGAGGVVMTVDDLVRWETGLFRGTVLQPQTAAELLLVRHESDGAQASYYGNSYTLPSGKKALVRTGAQDFGFGSGVVRYHDPAVTVILVLNRQVAGMDVSLLRTRVLMNVDNLLFGNGTAALPPVAQRVQPAEARQWTGVYQLADSSTLEVQADSANLIITPRGLLAVDVFAFDSAGRETRMALARRAGSLIGALCRGDVAPFRTALRDTTGTSRFEAHIRTAACDSTQARFSVLGSMPRWWDQPATTEPATLVAGMAGGRSRLFRIEWGAERITALGGAAVGVPAMRFAAVGNNGYIGHHLGSGRTVRLRFERVNGASVLQIDDAGRVLPARRIN